MVRGAREGFASWKCQVEVEVKLKYSKLRREKAEWVPRAADRSKENPPQRYNTHPVAAVHLPRHSTNHGRGQEISR